MAIICTAHNLLRKAWKRAWKTSGDIEERSGELEQRWRKAFCASCQDKISSCLFCSMLLLKFCRGISMNLWHYDYHYYVPYGYVRYMFATCSIFSDLFFWWVSMRQSQRDWGAGSHHQGVKLPLHSAWNAWSGVQSVSRVRIQVNSLSSSKRRKIWDPDGSCKGSLRICRDLRMQHRPITAQTQMSSLRVLESLGSLGSCGSWVNKEHIWPVAAPYASHELEWASVDGQIQWTATVSCDVLQYRKLCVQFLRFQLCIHLGFGLSL